MRAVDIIRKKRDGQTIDGPAFAQFLNDYLKNSVNDYQMAAFLMAVVFNGLTPDELQTLTETMIRSGETLDLSDFRGQPKIDKHSTGGVGDKTSLIIAPLVAEMGILVPMISGRGLGH